MKRIILIVIITLVVVFTAAIIYIGKTILPTKIKTELITKLETQLQRKIQLKDINFSLLKGVVIHDLIISDDPAYSQVPLLQIQEADVNIPWLTVILKRQFIIGSVTINSMQANIIRLDKNLWNFSSLIQEKPQTGAKNPALLVYKAAVLNSKISFEDRTFNPAFTETIDDLNLKLNLSLSLKVKFSLEAKIKNTSPASSLTARGEYNIPNKKLSAKIKTKDILVNKYYSYFQNPNLQIKNLRLQDSDIDLELQDKKLRVQALATLSDLDILSQQIEVLGSLSLNADATYDPNNQNPLVYSGKLNTTGIILKGLPTVGSAENITGTLAFETDKIQTNGLTALVRQTPVKISGTLENFANPIINARIDSDIKLASIVDLIPQNIKNIITELDGNAKLETNLQGYVKDAQNLNYSIRINLSQVSGKLNYLADKLSNIQGEINFDKNGLAWQNLSTIYKTSSLASSGTLRDFSNPIISAELKSDIKLSEVLNLIPDKAKANISELDGDMKLQLRADGPVNSIYKLEFVGLANFSGASLKLNSLPEKILNINGDVIFDKTIIKWSNLSCLYKDIPVTFNGSLSNLINPVIETDIKSDLLNLTTKINTDKNTIGISQLDAKYLNSSFSATASLDTTDKENLLLSANFNSLIQLADLKNISDKLKDIITQMKLSGQCAIKGNVNGPIRKPADLNATLSANSTDLSLYGLKFYNTQANYVQAQNMIKDSSLIANAYDGQLTITANANLTQDYPYVINAQIADVNLAKLVLDTPLKDKPISGTLNSEFRINGKGQDTALITGGGNIDIKDGNLWELDLLKGIGELLSLGEFSNIVFNAVKGDFVIQDSKVQTNNLQCLSDKLTLNTEGNIDFKKNLDLLVRAQFNQPQEPKKESSGSLGDLIAGAIGAVGDIVSQVLSFKITGTTDKPMIKKIIEPTNILQKVLGVDLKQLQQ